MRGGDPVCRGPLIAADYDVVGVSSQRIVLSLLASSLLGCPRPYATRWS